MTQLANNSSLVPFSSSHSEATSVQRSLLPAKTWLQSSCPSWADLVL